MLKNIYSIWSSPNTKVYFAIAALTIAFLGVAGVSIKHIKVEFDTIASSYRRTAQSELFAYIDDWMISHKRAVGSYANIYSDLFLDDEAQNGDIAGDFIETLSTNNRLFDSFQMLLENKSLHASNGFKLSEPGHLERIKAVQQNDWFKETKRAGITSIYIKETHNILNQKTLNICSPISKDGDFKGVLCGIIKADRIFDYIKGIDKSFITHLCLADRNGDIITSFGDTAYLEGLMDQQKNYTETQKSNINFAVLKDPTTDWTIAIGIDEYAISRQNIEALTREAVWLFMVFALLVVFANYLHGILLARSNAQKKEYEQILEYRLKMSETGELIGVISHQLNQPINAAQLMLSSLLQLKNDKNCDPQMEIESINLCLKSMQHMSETIANFRDFYKYDIEVREFELNAAISSLLNILHIELSKNSVSVEVAKSEPITIKNRKNLFLQVLLVLIQNAKEAVLFTHADEPRARKISIDIIDQNELLKVRVSDTGGGIAPEILPKLFSNLKQSQKKNGSGIGLYFARKIATDRLGGDLRLINPNAPTTFELTIQKNYKG